MIDISFDQYQYFPVLRTRQAELKGLDMLDDERRAKIIPMLTLGRWPKALDFTRAAEKAEEATKGHPHFLDLTTDGAHLADQQKLLREPSDAFAAWRNFVAQYRNAIPVVQLVANSRVRDTTRQAQLIERTSGKLAFRIRDFATDTPLVINALSALDDPKSAIVFIDCQYIRNALTAYGAASIATINQLRAEFPELMIALLSTSFPSSTISFADAGGERGSIDILERNLHASIGGNEVAAYGDHASIHSVVYDDAPIMRWAARIDYPRNLDWYFERRPQNQTADGYISAAQGIVASDPDIGTRGIWGEKMIIDAAQGNPHAKAPGPWISVRVNIHLSRQIDFSYRPDADLDDEDLGEE